MSDSPYIYEVTAENFEQIVLNGSFQVPVLIDFWASWCQPCQMLMPVLSQLAEDYQGKFILAKVNTEEQQELAQHFGIRSIPTVKLFKQGQEVDEFAGALPEGDIRAFLDKHIARESDGAAEQGEMLLANGDAEGALSVLSAAQAEDPSNWRILINMAKAHATLGNWDAANEALSVLPEDEQNKPEVAMIRGQMHFASIAPAADELSALQERLSSDENDSEARYKLAIHLVMQQQFAAAIDALLNLMMRDRAYEDDAARTTLIKLFDILGDDPLVAQSRRRMFNLMH